MDNANAIQATGTFVTNKGFNLITKLVAAQATLEFTRAAVGTGKPPEGYSPEAMIGLNAYKMDAEISDYGVQDDMAYVTAQISSDNVQEGFLATEVGIFAEDPDEGEILYGYMDISTDPTYIYANGSSNRSKFAEFTLYMLIGSVSSVVAAVTPGSIITKETFRAENMQATDTYGFLGGAEGASSSGQAMMDAIVNRIMTQLVTNSSLMEQLGAYVLKSKIVNNFLATDAETVLSGPMGKSLKDQLDVLNTKQNQLDNDFSEFKRTDVNKNDIDDISQSGFYRIMDSPDLLIHVRWDTNYMAQLMFPYGKTQIAKIRNKFSGTWNDWWDLKSLSNFFMVQPFFGTYVYNGEPTTEVTVLDDRITNKYHKIIATCQDGDGILKQITEITAGSFKIVFNNTLTLTRINYCVFYDQV